MKVRMRPQNLMKLNSTSSMGHPVWELDFEFWDWNSDFERAVVEPVGKGLRLPAHLSMPYRPGCRSRELEQDL